MANPSNAEWVRFERDLARSKQLPVKVDMAVFRNALEQLDPANGKGPLAHDGNEVKGVAKDKDKK